MQEPPPLLVALWIVLVVVSALAAFVLGVLANVFNSPIQALPVGFWLATVWPLALICAPFVLWRNRIRTTESASRSTIQLGHASSLFAATIFLLMAFFNNLWEPDWGGNTIIFLIVGLLNASLAVSYYRRSAILKQR
jgi:hypothetical protein